MIFDVVALVGLTLMMFQDINILLLGRFVFGFGAGVLSTATTVVIGDMVPAGYSGQFGFLANLSFTAAAMMFAYGLDDRDIYHSEYYWRIIIGCPFAFCITQIVVLGFFIREDTMLYLIEKDRREEALIMMRRVYHASENVEVIYDELKREIDAQKKEAASVSFSQTLRDPRYKYATYFCIFLFISAIQSGLSAILIYSTKIFIKLRETG